MVPEATPALAQPSVIATITGLSDANDVAYDPVHNRMYVTSGPIGDVYVIDVDTNTQITGSPIDVGGTTNRITYDPEHRTMYVTDRSNNNVRVINTDDITETPVSINIGSRSEGIAYNPDNEMMYVAAPDVPGRGVIIIDTDTSPPSIFDTVSPLSPGFSAPGGIAYDSDHQRMYVTRLGEPFEPGGVDIIDTSMTPNVLDTTNGPITVGDFPQFGISYDPVHQTMYVPDDDHDVSVIDTITAPNPIVTTIAVSTAHGIAYDPVNEEMYVGEAINAPSNVRVIDTNTNTLVGDPIPVGNSPIGIAYEPVNGRMYVANSGSDSVTVIQTPGFGGTATAN
jgi:DNA-binding beta-propeller fold protein YncE